MNLPFTHLTKAELGWTLEIGARVAVLVVMGLMLAGEAILHRLDTDAFQTWTERMRDPKRSPVLRRVQAWGDGWRAHWLKVREERLSDTAEKPNNIEDLDQ